jgi:hypothetical protein
MIPHGAMGILIGLFVPDDIRKWPAVDRDNPGIQSDIAALMATAGGAGTGHRH